MKDEARIVEELADIDALRRAARVLRRRSRKPDAVVNRVMQRILTDLATTIEDDLEDTS
jgi:hypothetical protein